MNIDLNTLEAVAKAATPGPTDWRSTMDLLAEELQKARAAQKHWQRVATIIADVLVDYQEPAGVPLHKRNSQEQILSVASYAAARDAIEEQKP